MWIGEQGLWVQNLQLEMHYLCVVCFLFTVCDVWLALSIFLFINVFRICL